MSAARDNSFLAETAEVIEPPSTVVKVAAVLAVVLFVGFSIFYSAGAKAQTAITCNQADLNGDGRVTLTDALTFSSHMGAKKGDANYDIKFDLDGNGVIDKNDINLLQPVFGQTCSVPTPSASPPPCAYGDIDGSGKVDSVDAMLVSSFVSGQKDLTLDQLNKADVDADGQITSADASAILNFVSGKISVLKACTTTPPALTVNPIIDLFSVSPLTLYKGGPANVGVVWSVRRAYGGCSASSSPVVPKWSGQVNSIGSAIIFPSSASTLTLTCTGVNSTVSAPSASVVIKAPCGGLSSDPIQNSHLYSSSQSGKVYVAENCQKRWITSSAVFDVCRYDWGKIETPLQGYLDNVANGADVLSTPCPEGPRLPPPADLTVTSFSVSPVNPAPGQSVTANITVLNKGAKLPPCGQTGDVDGDGMITNNDSAWILQHAGSALTAAQIKIGDVNGDGAVDSLDALKILRYLAGSDATFPVCGTATPPPTPVSGSFRVDVYANQPAVAGCNTSGQATNVSNGLAVGSTITLNYSFNAPQSAGNYTARVFADSQCSVAELLETNNQATANYTVTVAPACPSVIVPRHLYYNSAGTAFVITDNCQKRGIASADAFNACHYDWNQVETTTDSLLSTLVNGPVVTGPPDCPPAPVSSGGQAGNPGTDAIKYYLRSYIACKYQGKCGAIGINDGRNVPGYIATDYGEVIPISDIGQFLWGLAGCESGWDPGDYAGPPYHELGLFQYQHAYIPGYGDSRDAPYGSDVWGNVAVNRLGGSLGTNIFSYQDQIRVTDWKVSANGGRNANGWSCYTGGGWWVPAQSW